MKKTNTNREKQERIWKKRTKEQLVIIVFFVVIGLVIINSIILYMRFDMTENNIYSISDVSSNMLSEIEDIIYIDYYISPKLKLQNDQPQQILDILQEYSSRSRGKVVVTEIDPNNPDVIAQGNIEKYQIEARQIQIVEKNEASFAVVYSGIVISYHERHKVIPFTLQSSVIEYQITSKILEVYNNDDRVVGIMRLDPQYNDQTMPELPQVLESDYKVETVSPGVPIDDKIDVLFIAGSRNVDNDTAYYIDQFLMSGRGIYFAVDRVRVDINQGIQIALQQDSLLDKMLTSYGITVEPKIALDTLNKQIPVNAGRGFQILQQYPMWVTISEQFVDAKHPITSRFGGLDLYWTSPLTILEDKKEYFTNIVKTTPEAWTVEGAPLGEGESVQFMTNPDPTGFLAKKNADNTGQYNVVSTFVGPLKSAAETGIITMPANVELDSYVAKSTTQSRFVVIGSSHFMTSLYRYTNAGYNFSFLSNISDWLSSDIELLKIKSRSVRNTQLNKIIDTDKRNKWIFLVKMLNLVIVPVIIILVAILMMVFRRNLAQKRY